MDSNPKTRPPTKIESFIVRFMILVGVLSILNFLYFFFDSEFVGYLPLYVLLCAILIYGAIKKLYLWYHYFNISVPDTPALDSQPTVDVLTTYFPGEPYEMIVTTLEAIQNISYPHTTYLCDEADDAYLKKQCKRLGVIHVTRDNRIDAKAGNINNALKQATGEICLVLDPDHIPEPNFLDTVLPHFKDEKIGFVQVVQSYYNKFDSLVARGAAEQTFQFYGPMMMCMNSYGTVNAIGANCTFRREALDSIGGHAPGLAEDMHTAMLLHATGWKSVYVPELVAKGLAPPDLASYFKQQLKWSRGTFELLYSVYPEQFKNFTLRQRIHYALLPLHYLVGFVYLISFLIPIIALVFSKMPWTGDILYFAVVSLPVLMSSLLIRTYIQKWVIEKYDRGFHIIGGLLQIITWWVLILGVSYTFIRKKVPYLPTPKSEEGTHLGITVPNLIVAALSIFAIVYGLSRDLTPFSLIMALFAALNALFMFFSVYLAFQVTNRNRILRSTLQNRTIEGLKRIKKGFIDLADKLFILTRHLALPLLLLSLLVSGLAVDFLEKEKWNPNLYKDAMVDAKYYLGVFNPSQASGITDLEVVRQFEKRENIDFSIISFYMAWGDATENRISPEYLKRINTMAASPLITWEPWAAGFRQSDSLLLLSEKKGMYTMITEGYFDEYILQTAEDIKAFENTVFLRYAHEFDNPFYPWSLNDLNTPENFKKAWRYVHDLFREAGAENVQWVWSPWKANVPADTYPGDKYVDWLGSTLLNYGDLNSDGVWYPFSALYGPINNAFEKFPKPVMLSEFGSLALGGDRGEWLAEAFDDIDAKYPKIKAVVFFNSRFDKNIPENRPDFQGRYLDWEFKNIELAEYPFFRPFDAHGNPQPVKTPRVKKGRGYKTLPLASNIRGVNYKKSDHWLDNNYIANRDVLQRDLEMMKAAGINTLKFRHSDIYSYNVLRYAADTGMDVWYSFTFPKDLDVVGNPNAAARFRRFVLNQVETLKKKGQIVGWNLERDPWNEWEAGDASGSDRHDRYLQWLTSLASEIKKIDSVRPLVKEMKLSQRPEAQIAAIINAGIFIDGFGIEIDDASRTDDFLEFAEKNDVPYMISAMPVDQLANAESRNRDKAIFIQNWQNQWETGKITLNGLLDFKGRKKMDYKRLADYWVESPADLVSQTQKNIQLPLFKILKPAIPLMKDDQVSYHALVFKDGQWSYPESGGGLSFEWYLAQYDAYGEIRAIKKLSDQSQVELTVPPGYEKFGLILTVAQDGYSKTFETPLNTPSY